MLPPSKFQQKGFNGTRGKRFSCLGGRATFVVYKHKNNTYLQTSGPRGPYKIPPLYPIDPSLYAETYLRYIFLKNARPGAEKVACNYGLSPQKSIPLQLNWRCANKVICPYLAAIR